MNGKLVQTFTVLLACQLAGEVAARLLGLPVPGPVVGMVLLFALLAIRGGVPEEIGTVAGGLLRNLSLLFVPAGVGVMLHASLLFENWLALSATLVLSAVVTLIVTGLVMSWLVRQQGSTPEGVKAE